MYLYLNVDAQYCPFVNIFENELRDYIICQFHMPHKQLKLIKQVSLINIEIQRPNIS